MSAARHHLRAQDDDDRRLPDALLALGRARPAATRSIRQDEQYGDVLSERAAGPNPMCTDQNGIAAEMIDRRHEKLTLDALQDLVALSARRARGAQGDSRDHRRLAAVPPERTARAPAHVPGRADRAARSASIRGPGRLTDQGRRPAASARAGQCDTDRMRLAQHRRRSRSSASCSTRRTAPTRRSIRSIRAAWRCSTRRSMRQDVPGAAAADASRRRSIRRMLRGRINSLRTLAEATDGLAIVNSNDLAGGLKRVVDDLSSYYLLGYYSTGKLDGKFHPITVRVKRPGVQVRARRGYLAATPATAAAAGTRARPAAAAPALEPAEAPRRARGRSGDRAAGGLHARRAAAPADGGGLEARRQRVGGDVGRRRARRRGDDRRRLERRLRRHGHADDAGRCDASASGTDQRRRAARARSASR